MMRFKNDDPWTFDYSLQIDAHEAVKNDEAVSALRKKYNIKDIDFSGAFVRLDYIHVLRKWFMYARSNGEYYVTFVEPNSDRPIAEGTIGELEKKHIEYGWYLRFKDGTGRPWLTFTISYCDEGDFPNENNTSILGEYPLPSYCVKIDKERSALEQQYGWRSTKDENDWYLSKNVFGETVNVSDRNTFVNEKQITVTWLD